MTWDWRKQFRRQFGYEPGTIVRTDHLVTTPASAPARKNTRGGSGTARKASGTAVAATPTAVETQVDKGLGPFPVLTTTPPASTLRPTTRRALGELGRAAVRQLGDGVEARTIDRSAIVAECEPAPAATVPMVEIGPGRRVNAVSFKKLRQGGDL